MKRSIPFACWAPALATLLLWTHGRAAHADGLHLPDFENLPIQEAWARYKRQNRFPNLPEGKTWSDLIDFGPADSRDLMYNRVGVSAPPREVLVVVTAKMIAILRYAQSDYFTFSSPDPPLWYYTKKGRDETIQQAKAILAEIGWQALPYLWEALEREIRFSTGNDREKITRLQAALQNLETAGEALDTAMRERSAMFCNAERDMDTMMERFLDPQNHEKKDGIAFDKEFHDRARRLAQLIDDYATFDAQIRRLREKRSEAERLAREWAAKMPGAYKQYYLLDTKVADTYVSDLKAEILRCGERAIPLMREKVRHGNQAVARAAKDLLYQLTKQQGQERLADVPEKPAEFLPAPDDPIADARLREAARRLEDEAQIAELRQAYAESIRITHALEKKLAELDRTKDAGKVAELRGELAQALRTELNAKEALDRALEENEGLRPRSFSLLR